MMKIFAFLLFVGVSFGKKVNTTGFPEDFIWGTATAAYQVEGAAREDGRKESIWDVFSQIPGKVFDGDTGDVADDFYHRFREDIELMSDLGIDSFRLSLSWPRIIPDGTGDVNQLGIDFYNDLIDELLAHGIKPFVTLYHWDLPNALQEDYGGWLDRDRIVPDFVNYADVAFNAFGDRVKNWLTFNEPMSFVSGYKGTTQAPGIVSPLGDFVIPGTISIAHAMTVDLYRTKYEPTQGGEIGITLNADWCEPLTEAQADVDACNRQMLATLGLYADPVFFGDYGDDMKAFLGDKLNVFTDEEKALLKGSQDFFGLNHYSSRYGSNDASCSGGTCTIISIVDEDGVQIGAQSASDFLIVAPFGFRSLLGYIKDRYDDPPIYVTENGYSDPDLPLEMVNEIIPPLLDTGREDQILGYLEEMRLAIVEDHVDVRSYFHWSLMDNFEWAEGFSKRFGLIYVDIKGDLARHPKASFDLYKKWILAAKKKSIPRAILFPDEADVSVKEPVECTSFDDLIDLCEIEIQTCSKFSGCLHVERASFCQIPEDISDGPDLCWKEAGLIAQGNSFDAWVALVDCALENCLNA